MIDDEDVILRKFGVLVCSGTPGVQAALVARLGASEGGRALLAALDFDASQALTHKDAVAQLGQGNNDNPHRFVFLYENFAAGLTPRKLARMHDLSWAGPNGLAVIGVAGTEGRIRMEVALGVIRFFTPDGDPAVDIYPAIAAASSDLSTTDGAADMETLKRIMTRPAIRRR